MGRNALIYRHIGNSFPYITLRKLVNLGLNYIEHKFKISKPRSFPPYIKIEPTPLCQLRCPGCKQRLTGYRKQFRNSMQITLDQFAKIVDPLSDTLLGISLSNHGEPLLHKNISSLIKYAHNKNIAVSFPTNMSVKLNTNAIEDLVQSGLDSVLVSLDGASQETYSKYRVGGNFSLILKNVSLLAKARRRFGLKRPKLIWKFVVFDHNRHELDYVRKRYRELGFDSYSLVRDRSAKSKKSALRAHKTHLQKTREGCFWLWNTTIIRWDGEVFPCCKHNKFDLGNAIAENVLDIWRSKAYTSLRQGFKRPEKEMHQICRKCMGYDKRT